MADQEFDSEDEDQEELFLFDQDQEEDEAEAKELMKRRSRAYAAVSSYEDAAGEKALNDIVQQCERRLAWQLECVSDRSTIDDLLMSRYNIYDPDAWLRYRNSWFEKRLRHDMHHIGMMHSAMFARALARKKLGVVGRSLLFTRELFWSLVKKIDTKLQNS